MTLRLAPQRKTPKVDNEPKLLVPHVLCASLILPRLLPFFSRFGPKQLTHSHSTSAHLRLWTHRKHCLAHENVKQNPISSQDTKKIREYDAQFSLLFLTANFTI